jgi:competence protein ComEC
VRSPRPSLWVLLGIAVLIALGVVRGDEIRARAEAGLGAGVPDREAALARGFVLGADEGIDPATKEDFRRAGLAHLLAVSGQNVTLLALLAMPALAAFGIALRERLVWLLALIAVYVPLAGAGPSIQRAGVMGAAGLVATISGRRTPRLYALVLALGLTLAIDPGVAADVGWQLSFAAVGGIFALASPLRSAIARRLGPGSLRHLLAEGGAVTIAATLATAPLIAFHFGRLSTTTLAANLLAMPAVAPAMWLGMASAAAAQIPGFPVEALNWPASCLLGYVAQIAAWCAAPGWAELELELGPAGLVGAYLGIALSVFACLACSRRLRLRRAADRGRRRDHGYPPTARRRRPSRPLVALLAVVLCVATAGSVWDGGGAGAGVVPGAGLRVEVLDVGQGDAILLQPAAAPAILIDGGPPGDDLLGKLTEAGVERLGAAVITHDQSDHAAGVEELLGRLPVARLVYGRLAKAPLAAAEAAGATTLRLAQGAALRSGALTLRVLWPPPELLAQPPADPNQAALVLLARWHDFTMLLSADAEAEAVPLDPGPLDVLKVAHHGSDDAGLAELLDRARPRLAVISVGEGNTYGHPTAATIATLAARGVRTLRTDRDGDVLIDVGRRGFVVEAGG